MESMLKAVEENHLFMESSGISLGRKSEVRLKPKSKAVPMALLRTDLAVRDVEAMGSS